MSDSTMAALAELVQMLGISDAIDVLEFALPRIISNRDKLLLQLSAGSWDAAAQIAHQTINSAHLYSSSQFEQKLRLINEKIIEVISTSAFQRELFEEFTAIEQGIRVWLSVQKGRQLQNS